MVPFVTPRPGLKAFIAVHNTNSGGPSSGGDAILGPMPMMLTL